MKTNNIKFSKKDKISENEFDSKNVKIRITTFIDLDILEKLKEEASLSGKKYQTLLNDKLRQVLFDEEAIHSTLVDLDKRLKSVERRIKVG